MTKVFPNIGASNASRPGYDGEKEEVLTVWRKSLLFNCSGFTVFDKKGNLVFRVDNYASGNKGEVVLMDAAGKSLLTIRRKKLSLGDHWLVFAGEESVNPLFSVKKPVNFLNSRLLAQLTVGGGSWRGQSSSRQPAYAIEGSYSQRSCVVYDDKRRPMAEIRRKEAVGGVAFGQDVFRLVVQPELDAAFAMALVILLEQMFGSRRASS
ncbi:protein LURP-one-related 8-like [Aristolochia californica]|uniref:protein LURP-one-related 8-like n=1 Tax=Aristolochia californica TaxID=171875 RepID=UPI0035E0FC7E